MCWDFPLTCSKSKTAALVLFKMPVMFLPDVLMLAAAVTKRVEQKFVVLRRIRTLGARSAPSAHPKCLLYTFRVSEASLPFIFDNGGLVLLGFFLLLLFYFLEVTCSGLPSRVWKR